MIKKNTRSLSTALVKRDPDAIEPASVDKPEAQTAIVKRNELPTDINIAAVEQKFQSIAAFQALVQRQLKEGLDYGVIPGTKKKTLLKPGAEKIAKLLDLADLCEETDKVEDWEKPFFKYDYKVRLVSLLTGQTVSEGIGSCNSMESKYRWRWVPEAELPAGIDRKALKTKGFKKTVFEPGFAIDKASTEGKYGKPEAYWQGWRDAIKSGKAKPARKALGKNEYDGFEMVVDSTLYQLPNDDIYSQVNTIKKMSKKRALVDAGLSVGRLSDLFTQDLEDMMDSEAGEAPQEEAPPPEKKVSAAATAKKESKKETAGKAGNPRASAPPAPGPGPAVSDVGGDPGPDEIADYTEGDQPAMTPEEEKRHEANVQAIQMVLERNAPDIDYKDFKKFLAEAQAGKSKVRRIFVREKFGNLSLEAGDPGDVAALLSNLNVMLDKYLTKRMKEGKGDKGKKG